MSDPLEEGLPKLTLKGQLFAEAMLSGCSAGEAMRRIGGHQQHSLDYEHNPAVQLYMAKRLAEHQVTTDTVLAVLAGQLHVNPSLFTNDDGSINVAEMRMNGHQIRDYSYTRDEKGKIKVSVKCYDAQKTAGMFARILGMEQEAGTNRRDLERLYNAAKRYAADTGGTIEDAINDLKPQFPKMAKLTPEIISELEH